MNNRYSRGPAGSAVAFILMALPGSPARGQSTFAGVVGTVIDFVTGATVKLTEVQTNVSRSALTTNLGTYEFVNINQGVCKLDVVSVCSPAAASPNNDFPRSAGFSRSIPASREGQRAVPWAPLPDNAFHDAVFSANPNKVFSANPMKEDRSTIDITKTPQLLVAR